MNDYFLSHGSHRTAADGRCAMEWVSYLAGEPHSDSPACVCPVLTRFCVAFNDGLPDDRRQRLRPYLARTIGTRDDGLADARTWLATDWLVRTYTPAWLELAGLDEVAGRLRSLPPVLAVETLTRAMDALNVARAAAWDAREVAKDAAKDAARDAAKDAAWAAARAAARAAAWAAAWDVAWEVARDAAWDAVSTVTREALAPTVDELQRSAFDLLDRMLPTEAVQIPVVEDAKLVCGAVA